MDGVQHTAERELDPRLGGVQLDRGWLGVEVRAGRGSYKRRSENRPVNAA